MILPVASGCESGAGQGGDGGVGDDIDGLNGHCCVEPSPRSLAVKLPEGPAHAGLFTSTNRIKQSAAAIATAWHDRFREGLSEGFAALDTLDRSMQQCQLALDAPDATRLVVAFTELAQAI